MEILMFLDMLRLGFMGLGVWSKKFYCGAQDDRVFLEPESVLWELSKWDEVYSCRCSDAVNDLVLKDVC